MGLENTLGLALRLALSKAGISLVLVGFSDTSQLEAAMRWAGRGTLDADAVERILRAFSW